MAVRDGDLKTPWKSPQPTPQGRRDTVNAAQPSDFTPVQRKREKVSATAECVAVDAVRCEPVSDANSLLTGNLTGNFEKIGPFGAKSRAKRTEYQNVRREFPKSLNRELFLANREVNLKVGVTTGKPRPWAASAKQR